MQLPDRHIVARTTAPVVVVVIAIGIVLLPSPPNASQTAALRQAAAQIASAEQARTAATAASESARTGARAAERVARAAVSRAAVARARARVVGANQVLAAATPTTVPVSIRVPVPVVERMRLDSTAVAALGTLVQWKDSVIVRQDGRITADSLKLALTSKAFGALQRAKEPRCGRKCGIALGVGGTVAAAVAVEQVLRAFR